MTSSTWADAFLQWSQGHLGDEGREYLWGRGVSTEQMALFRLGFIPESPVYPAEVPKAFTDWASRSLPLPAVVLPLTSFSGALRGFQFRSLREKRYLDYKVVPHGPDFFGAREAAASAFESQVLWAVEGVFDLFPLQRLYPNVVATLTARVSVAQARTLRRFVKVLAVAFDADDSGQRGLAEATAALEPDLRVVGIKVPMVYLAGAKKAKDLGEVWEAWGDQRFQEAIKRIAGMASLV